MIDPNWTQASNAGDLTWAEQLHDAVYDEGDGE